MEYFSHSLSLQKIVRENYKLMTQLIAWGVEYSLILEINCYFIQNTWIFFCTNNVRTSVISGLIRAFNFNFLSIENLWKFILSFLTLGQIRFLHLYMTENSGTISFTYLVKSMNICKNSLNMFSLLVFQQILAEINLGRKRW